MGSVFSCCGGGQRRGQGQGVHKDSALVQVLPPRGGARPVDPCLRRSSPVRRGCSWGYRPLPQHRKGPSVLSTLAGGTGASMQSPVGQRPVSVGHSAPGRPSSSRAPQPPAWGCLVTQHSLPGRGFALGSHFLTVGKGSEMTPHHSWQQHLPRLFWGSPGIQLHWENLWERGQEDQCQLFIPGVSPCLGERCGTEISVQRWGGSQSLRQPPRHVPPPEGLPSRAMGQPLPWAQALLHPYLGPLPARASDTCRGAISWSSPTPRWASRGPWPVLSGAWVPLGRVPV